MIRTAIASLLRRSQLDARNPLPNVGRLPAMKRVTDSFRSRINDSLKTYSTVPKLSSLQIRRSLPGTFVWGSKTYSLYTQAGGGLERSNLLFDRRIGDPSTNPLVFVTPTHQKQQIRTFAIRPKRKRRFQQFLQWKADLRSKGIQYPNHPKYRDRRLDFQVQIKKLLSKVTRGPQTKWFMQDFVRRYPTYSQDKRDNHVIPHIAESLKHKEFDTFFLRIMREITVENNDGIHGFVFLIQFREELMNLIFTRVEELKTLTRKVKLMRLKLRKLDYMKWRIRKAMGDYIFLLCSQPLPAVPSPEPVTSDSPTKEDVVGAMPQENSTTAVVADEDDATILVAQENSATAVVADEDDATTVVEESEPSVEEDFSHEVPPEYRSGPSIPPPPPIDQIPLDSEMVESDEPRALGCIRRLQYSDLSYRFLKRYARKEPYLTAHFRGSNKRVYGWFQDETKENPDVIIYVAFVEAVPKTLEDALVDNELSEGENLPAKGFGDAEPKAVKQSHVKKETVKGENLSPKLKVATFYGATILHRALENTGIAEYCVRPIMRMLLEDVDTPSSISVFSTLSPIYKFRQWLLHEDFEDDITLLVVNEGSDDFLTLAREWNCPNDQVFRRMKSLLDSTYESYRESVGENPVVETAINNLLLRCASSYITKGKTPVVNWRCDPLELSTRFHVAQGASVFRLNLAADTTEAGWTESFGIRTNFIFDRSQMEANQKKFNKSFSAIDFHENVTRYLPKPRKLKLNKEQKERWIKTDPVRKKMIELSQNGKLFKVPLFGPPTLSYKKPKKYLGLVPLRTRPSAPLPPPAPTVGVSGLTITLKPPPPVEPFLPSYIARTLPGGVRKVGEGSRRGRREPSNGWPDEVEFGHIEEAKPPISKRYAKRLKRLRVAELEAEKLRVAELEAEKLGAGEVDAEKLGGALLVAEKLGAAKVDAEKLDASEFW
jgi:Malonyl-CoA decarboxylase C-terminal domain